VTVLCFVIANTVVWAAWHRAYAPGRDILRVERFEPGDGATVGPRAELSWQFNLDVGRPGVEWVGDAPAAVTPPVAGKWRWADTRTLLFVPDHDLPRATRVQFRLSPQRLRTADGYALPAPHETSVVTEGLSVTGVRQAAFEDGDRYVLELTFNDRVLPADLLGHLSLTTTDGRTIKCYAHGDVADTIVRLLTDPVVRASGAAERVGDIHVNISEGLAGLSGPLGMAQPFETKLRLEQALAATTAGAECPAQGKPMLRLWFNGAVDIESLKQVISVEPAVPYTIGTNYGCVDLRGDFSPGMRYAVKISKAPAGANARLYPREGTLSALVPDRSAGVWFDHAEGYLGAQGNRTLLAHAVNLRELKATVWRVYDNNLVAWRNAGNGYSWRQTEAFSQPIATKLLKVDAAKNEVRDVPLALGDLLPPSAPRDGVYRITLAENRAGTDDSDDLDENSGDSRGRYYLYSSSRSASAVATLSDIGLTAKAGRDSVTIWAVSLHSAEPVAGVRVRVYSDKNQLLGESVTDERGLATIANIHPGAGERPSVVLAEMAGGPPGDAGEHPGRTWLDLRSSSWELADTDVSGRPYLREGHEAFVYTDRGVYRPGETVYLRAIVRGKDDEAPAPFPVRWLIRRPDLHEYRRQVMMLDGDGAAGFALSLPADLPTGQWTASIGLPGEPGDSASGAESTTFGSVTFQVEEFMPDRMKVGVELGGGARPGQGGEGIGRFALSDKPLVASVQADYLFGQPAAGSQARLSTRIDPQRFSPPEWAGWSIGDDASLLSPAATALGALKVKRHRGTQKTSDDGVSETTLTLDDKGHASWELDLKDMLHLGDAGAAEHYMGPWRVSVAAGVQEAGGRAVTVARQIEVDALSDYLAVRAKGATTARPAEPIAFDVALVGIDGKVSRRDAGAIAAIFRETWNSSLVQREGRYRYESTRVLEPVKSDGELAVPVQIAGGRGVCTITLPASGSYVLRVKDPATGAMTSLAFYVSDGSPWDDSISREHPERLEVFLLPDGAAVPDEKDAGEPKSTAKMPEVKFRVGQKARVLVRSPFAGRLLLAVETDGVIDSQVVEMPASQVVVPVEVTDACRPNAYVTATVVRAIDPNVKWRTHRAFGATRLSVDPIGQKLQLAVTAPSETRPRQGLPVEVTVLDADGAPVSDAAITLAAVDEGILQLTGFATPDPLGYFTGRRALGVGSADAYSELMPEVARPDPSSSAGGDGAIGPRHSTPVHAKRIKPVSLVTEVLRTDEHGVARTTLTLPEFVGSLRLMAVGYSGPRFGSADRNVPVRSPLLVQSSFPRFAAPGDRFEVPLVVFNNTAAHGEAKIALEVLDSDGPAALLGFEDAKTHRLDLAPVTIPAGGQRTVVCTLTAGAAVGVAKIRLTAALGAETFEENVELPVRPASPNIARGGYAAASAGEACRLVVPGGMMPGTESLDIRVTPWPVLQLPAGLDYLERYPYGCAEQTISTCFPLAYLGDIGLRIAPGVFEPQRVNDKLQTGIYRLLGMQTADGGIAMWPGGRESWPWASIYAAHFLIEAEKAGHPVPEDFRRHLLAYARRLVDQGGDVGDLVEAQSYACYVLALAGKPDRAAMSRLGELTRADAPALPETAPQRASGRMWLALAWLSSGRRDLALSLLPQSPPLPRQGRQSAGNVGSTVRDRALAIDALLQVQPENPAIPALVQQLADSGAKGQWRSTQDSAFAVMALGRYLRQAKSASPCRQAELWLGDGQLAAANDGKPIAFGADPALAAKFFAGISADSGRTFKVRITGDEKAHAYVSWVQSGVPLATPPDQDQGMKVRRRYLNEDGSPMAGASVRSGQLIRVELTVQAAPGTDNLVIEDLFPAGLEIENPNLKTSAASEDQAHAEGQVTGTDGQELPLIVNRVDARDDRLVLMADIPQAGIGRYVYLVRAVAPGTFVVPPVHGECMYDEGVNSIANGGGTLTVERAGGTKVVER